MIKSGNKGPSKSTSWKVLETVMSHLNCLMKVLLDSAVFVDNDTSAVAE